MSSGALDRTLLAVAGLILTVTWWLLLRSYRDLNKAKFEVILAMEDDLPWRVYGDEWASLKRDPVPGWRGRYAELGTVERVVPAVLAIVYIALIVQESLR